ncbi:hypothetical protein [Chromobacterium sp. IIBBL 290-4]|uniref:hypothetical protein n=1 Tax=Chromobacterium sp. IIBBL 290-4 TaxID=2953890 RepID=UPI0020B7A4E1|nr:hypothetical protein [Chromobacterium sp. IIBBL 290-4]UTH73757.1 hypothetical protein NKT35_19770 [Chromobacterium sp. IIBBL 290-4]
MIVKLHKQARTMPAIRKEIQQTSGTQTKLAARYNVTIDTIRKWKSRGSFPHGPSAANHPDASPACQINTPCLQGQVVVIIIYILLLKI